MRGLATQIATVGGLGRVPWAPGTWGSAVGFLLGMMMVRIFRAPAHTILLLGSFVASTLICTHAEQELNRHDPPSIILDEVWAMWAIVAMLPWTALAVSKGLLAFVLFRLFDIAKPAPLQHLARLPSGLGIMADDLGAAVYVVLILWGLRQFLSL